MKRACIVLFVLFILGTNGLSFAETDSTAASVVEVTQDESHELPAALMVLPFVALLVAIATGPIFYHHFWEKNYPIIAVALGTITVIYYLVVLGDTHSLMHTLAEYLSFIALLASLFIASGGILI